MSKKSRFWGPFYKQHDKRAQALSKSSSQHLYDIHWLLLTQLSCKMFLLLISQILGVLLNTLAADEKRSFQNRENLTIPIQTQLSQKQKTFSIFFTPFLKSRWNFEHFDKKDDLHRFCNFDYRLQERGHMNVQKAPFGRTVRKAAW